VLWHQYWAEHCVFPDSGIWGFFGYLRIKSFYKIINIELNKLGVLKKIGIKWILNLTT
jgi:hypothetical protein